MNGWIKRGVMGVGGVLAVVLVLTGLGVFPSGFGAGTGVQAPGWGDDPSRRNDGEIMFTLTPQGVTDGRFLVAIRVDTHSGDLRNLDLKSQVRLNLDGQAYAPLEGVSLGGHHAGGTLAFPIAQVPERFEIVIRQVGTMGDVTLTWP